MRAPAHGLVGPRPLSDISRTVIACKACPRLVRYREMAAREGEARTGKPHWGRPVPGFGDPGAQLLVVGLAPAARGANRTGRIFTGDKSAAFLSAALYRAGFANQPRSEAKEDGLRYQRAYVTAAVRCVPPENKPTPKETLTCRPFLVEEMRALPRLRIVLCLGKLAWDSSFLAAQLAYGVQGRRTVFTHGSQHPLGAGLPTLWGAYHPSPRNTQTGLLSPAMFDRELRAIREQLAPD